MRLTASLDDDAFGLRALPSSRGNGSRTVVDAEAKVVHSFNPETDLVDLRDLCNSDREGNAPNPTADPTTEAANPRIVIHAPPSSHSPSSLPDNTHGSERRTAGSSKTLATLPPVLDPTPPNIPFKPCSDASTANNKLFVAGLSCNLSKDQLCRVFQKFGSVIDCHIVPHRWRSRPTR